MNNFRSQQNLNLGFGSVNNDLVILKKSFDNLNNKISIIEELLKKDDFFNNKIKNSINNIINEKIQQKIIECWSNFKFDSVSSILNSDDFKKINSIIEINTNNIKSLKNDINIINSKINDLSSKNKNVDLLNSQYENSVFLKNDINELNLLSKINNISSDLENQKKNLSLLQLELKKNFDDLNIIVKSIKQPNESITVINNKVDIIAESIIKMKDNNEKIEWKLKNFEKKNI